MTPTIKTLPEKKLIGLSTNLSLSDDKTVELWKKFMPNKKHIENAIGNDLYDIKVYDENIDFNSFTPNTVFTKWVATEVSDFDSILDGMDKFILKGGLYAVFTHKGLASGFPKLLQYIFGQWLPNSEYGLDNRAHFEILGEKYKNNDPSSEEEVWIPIKKLKN